MEKKIIRVTMYLTKVGILHTLENETKESVIDVKLK